VCGLHGGVLELAPLLPPHASTPRSKRRRSVRPMPARRRSWPAPEGPVTGSARGRSSVIGRGNTHSRYSLVGPETRMVGPTQASPANDASAALRGLSASAPTRPKRGEQLVGAD
jgi:hypothetical protein